MNPLNCNLNLLISVLKNVVYNLVFNVLCCAARFFPTAPNLFLFQNPRDVNRDLRGGWSWPTLKQTNKLRDPNKTKTKKGLRVKAWEADLLCWLAGCFYNLKWSPPVSSPLVNQVKGVSGSDVNLILIIVSASSLPPDEDGEAAMEGGEAGQEDTNSSCLGSWISVDSSIQVTLMMTHQWWWKSFWTKKCRNWHYVILPLDYEKLSSSMYKISE